MKMGCACSLLGRDDTEQDDARPASDARPNALKIVWGITGAGDYLIESIQAMRDMREHFNAEISVIASKSGEMVLKWYHLWDDLASSFSKIDVERGPNLPFLAGPLQVGRYDALIISPATANTVAKIAHGIADTLVTNCVAQAVKGSTPVYIYPVDQTLGSQETKGPKGEKITISTRPVDVENTERLREMEGITVLGHPSEILSLFHIRRRT
jgi:archaeoflavoprotein AfpA